jgi:Skp family chaperone for outer membrane proteins
MKILLLSLLTAFTASAQVVFVDLGNLVQRHPRTAHDKTLLQQAFDRAEAEINIKKTEVEKLNDDFEAAVKEAQNPALSAAAKKKAEDAVAIKRRDLLERDRQASEDVVRLRDQLAKQEEGYLEATTTEIRKCIEAVAKAKGYKAVLPKQLAIYSDPALDITEAIAKEMDFPPVSDAKAVTE